MQIPTGFANGNIVFFLWRKLHENYQDFCATCLFILPWFHSTQKLTEIFSDLIFLFLYLFVQFLVSLLNFDDFFAIFQFRRVFFHFFRIFFLFFTFVQHENSTRGKIDVVIRCNRLEILGLTWNRDIEFYRQRLEIGSFLLQFTWFVAFCQFSDRNDWKLLVIPFQIESIKILTWIMLNYLWNPKNRPLQSEYLLDMHNFSLPLLIFAFRVSQVKSLCQFI